MKQILLALCLLIYFTSSSQEVEKIYYKNNAIAKEKWLNASGKIDSLKTYLKTGELNEVLYFDTKGKVHGICYQLKRDGTRTTTWKFEHGKLIERTDHLKEYTIKNKEAVLKRYERIASLNEQIKKKPVFKYRFYRAKLRSSLGNTSLAQIDLLNFEKDLLKTLKLVSKPKHIKSHKKYLASLYNELAILYSRFGQDNKTLHYKYLAVKTNPKTVYKYNLGASLIYLKQYELGTYFLKEVLKENPNHSFANWALSIANTDLGEYEVAMEYAKVARAYINSIYTHSYGASDREPNTIEGYLNHKLGNTEKGINLLNDALEIKKENSFAMRYLGEIYIDLGNYSVACDFLQEAKSIGYEIIHGRNDLEALIDIACNRNFKTEDPTLKITAVPNPVVTTAKILNAAEDFNYVLFNYNQQIVQQGKANGNTIDFSSLLSGLYVLQIQNNNQITTLKILKQ